MSSDAPFLDTAAAIGRQIAADAVWHDGRCSWLGHVAEPAGPPSAMEYRPLGPALYGGTAGVGLFLAQLTAATGEAEPRRTAAGALRHAVARASLEPAGRDGLHAGALGIAWAAARAAVLLDEEELHAAARALLTETRPPSGPERCPDVVMGAAGAIAALLMLAPELGEPDLVEEAVVTGEALINRATITRHGCSWAIPGRRWPRHLCGVSHGAGGIGWALLELFRATQHERFRGAATGAFAYERSWLDRVSGTWPDLRIGGQRRGAPRTIPSPAIGSWCHGEAGIALSRLRAVGVLGPGPHRGDCEVALETTRRHLAGSLCHEIEDLSLCHGAAGAADVLVSAAHGLAGHWREASDVAADLGHVAIARHAETGRWPCGAGGTTPGLFRGLAGIGWLFLRLHDPTTPSPLILARGG